MACSMRPIIRWATEWLHLRLLGSAGARKCREVLGEREVAERHLFERETLLFVIRVKAGGVPFVPFVAWTRLKALGSRFRGNDERRVR